MLVVFYDICLIPVSLIQVAPTCLKPKACSSIPLEVVDPSNLTPADLNLQLVKGCYSGNNLQAQLDNAPASCNPPCFRITKPGAYCYMGTRNNNFSNRRHIGQITVTKPY